MTSPSHGHGSPPSCTCSIDLGWNSAFVGKGTLGFAMGKRAAKGAASSSSNGSPRSVASTSSPTSRMDRVGNYDLSHLAKIWDDTEVIRNQVREKHHLLMNMNLQTGTLDDSYVDGHLENVKLNSAALMPLLELMRRNDLLMPNIDRLIQSIDNFYSIAKRSKSLEHSYQMAWAFRRLLVKTKGLCYKDSPPQDREFWTLTGTSAVYRHKA